MMLEEARPQAHPSERRAIGNRGCKADTRLYRDGTVAAEGCPDVVDGHFAVVQDLDDAREGLETNLTLQANRLNETVRTGFQETSGVYTSLAVLFSSVLALSLFKRRGSL